MTSLYLLSFVVLSLSDHCATDVDKFTDLLISRRNGTYRSLASRRSERLLARKLAARFSRIWMKR